MRPSGPSSAAGPGFPSSVSLGLETRLVRPSVKMPLDHCSLRAVGRAEPETESGQSYGLGGIGLGREAGLGR